MYTPYSSVYFAMIYASRAAPASTLRISFSVFSPSSISFTATGSIANFTFDAGSAIVVMFSARFSTIRGFARTHISR